MIEKKRAIALGFFDGIHIGHAALLNKTNERSAEYGFIPSVLSFDIHPDNVVFGRNVPLINSAADRERIIKQQFNIDDVILLHFNRELMCMPWQEFAEKIIGELNIGWVVVGHDFSFGYRGEGTAARLKEYCDSREIGCDIIPAVTLEGEVVSSTYIRTLLENGDVERANRFLGHAHALTDTVKRGYHLGTKIGAPTVNMFFPEGVLVPRRGVYAAKVYLEDGSSYAAVTNVGVRPTVSSGEKVSVESHLLGYSGDLYGKQVRLELCRFIRDEMRFENVDELSAQIKRDICTVKEYFGGR